MEYLKTTYIFHDCFMVESHEALLVFDYWKNSPNESVNEKRLPTFLSEIDPDKKIYVFVSHGHKDHYNPAIFSWAKYFRNIKYIVSRDVRKRISHIVNPDSIYKGDKVDISQVVVLKNNDFYEDSLVKVRAFPSTDLGNSYAVELADKNIFHAGDLNAWIWKDESTEEEVNKALEDYQAILNLISLHYSRFDLCFFPVDSRIGTDYFTGAKIFLHNFDVKNFFPMHFELGEDKETVSRLHKDAGSFLNYYSSTCHRYIISSPFSSFIEL